MPPSRTAGATVFVGNINYDATEEQLKDIFSQVGTVVNFRVVYDNDTGRPKGYGFCEYEDAETAMSARRNLNGVELNGRQLRVDFTESEKGGGAGGGRNSGSVGPALPEALTGPTPSLGMLSMPQLHEVMVQLKRAVEEFPTETRDMFMKNPQLAHAVLQGQILLGMVPLPPPPPQSGMGMPGGGGAQRMPMNMPPGMPPAGFPSGMPPGMAPVRSAAMGGPPGPMQAPPGAMQVAPGGMQAPPTGMQAAPGVMQAQPGVMQPQPNAMQGGMYAGMPSGASAGMPGGTPAGKAAGMQPGPMQDQAALLKQVCEMTLEQINQLPSEQREQVMELRRLAVHQQQ